MQNTSCKMRGWMTHRLESKFPGEISTTSDMNKDCQEKYQQPQICRWYHFGRKWRGTKVPLDEGERGAWKSWLKTYHSKNTDHHKWSYHFINSVQFNSVLFDPLIPHGLQHTRPPYPSPTPGVYSNSCPLSLWCHPTISSSVIPFSSCLQSCPASGSSQVSQLFESGGQSIGVSASASVLSLNIQGWYPLGWTGWISLQSKGLSRVLQHHSSKASILQHSAFVAVLLSHPYYIIIRVI